MRMKIAMIPAALLLAGTLACGDDDDPDAMPGVNATGTADTEIFTDDPDTQGVPTAAQGGTPVDSVPPGTPGTPVATESDVGTTP